MVQWTDSWRKSDYPGDAAAAAAVVDGGTLSCPKERTESLVVAAAAVAVGPRRPRKALSDRTNRSRARSTGCLSSAGRKNNEQSVRGDFL